MKRAIIWILIIVLLISVCVPAAAASYPTLRKGSKGSNVTRLQNALKSMGYYNIAVDGIYGKGTVAAVKAFQSAKGLTVDGVAGPKTLTKLYESSGSGTQAQNTTQPQGGSSSQYATLSSGSKGSAVSALQKKLKALGYYTMSVDGAYGKGTTAAVKAFQTAEGLTANGIADSLTQERLFAKDTSQSSSSSTTTVTTLRLGDSGEAVTQMKNKLWYLGYYTGTVDDRFDDATRTAVIAFQRASSLTRDGIAGKKTFAALDSAYASMKANAGTLPDDTVSLLNSIVVSSGAKNGTLVLSKNGTTFLAWSFGGASQDTCYRIASITKWVTAIGLMTLYDQGRLDLDRDISEYLPFTVRNPAWPDTPITARMLLSHTSSLSPSADNYNPNWERIGVNGYDPLFNESAAPGTLYAYADYNGALFGCLIEAITGESVQNYLNRMVFQPLGLTAAYSPKYLPSGTKTKDLLSTSGNISISVQNDRNRAYNNNADPRGNNGYTVGKLYINASSLTKLAQMMLGGGELNGVRILNTDTVLLMEADQPGLAQSKYGLSTVRHSQYPRGTWYGHQGRVSGLTSNIYYQRETGITLALIMNGYDFQLEDNIVMPAVTLLKNMQSIEQSGLSN